MRMGTDQTRQQRLEEEGEAAEDDQPGDDPGEDAGRGPEQEHGTRQAADRHRHQQAGDAPPLAHQFGTVPVSPRQQAGTSPTVLVTLAASD